MPKSESDLTPEAQPRFGRSNAPVSLNEWVDAVLSMPADDRWYRLPDVDLERGDIDGLSCLKDHLHVRGLKPVGAFAAKRHSPEAPCTP